MDTPHFSLHSSTKSAISVDKLTMRRPMSLPPSLKPVQFEDDYPQHPHLILETTPF
jgi:hypothetical protein